MRSRVLILGVAIVLGLIGAFAAGRYLDSARKQVEAGTQPIEILVAAKPLAPGVTAEQALKDGAIVKKRVARQYVADEAVSSFSTIDGRVSAVDLSVGEQVTQGDFRFASDAGAAYSVPEGLLAVSVKDDPVVGVSRMLKPGDFVTAVATFEVQKEGGIAYVTKIVVPRARVLAVDQNLTAVQQGTSTQTSKSGGGLMDSGGTSTTTLEVNTVTLAVTPEQVERIVFADDSGELRLALISKSDEEPGSTKGVWLKDVVQ